MSENHADVRGVESEKMDIRCAYPLIADGKQFMTGKSRLINHGTGCPLHMMPNVGSGFVILSDKAL